MSYPLHSLHIAHEDTALVLVDIQERLMEAMDPGVRQTVIKNSAILLAGAQQLGLPVLVTEQYPKGIGATVDVLRRDLPGDTRPIEKVDFDVTAVPDFMTQLRATRRNVVVLAGAEAHICILQSTLGLLRAGYKVWVVEDAICSRSGENWRAAVRIMENAGVVVAPTETILFMMLRRAGSPEFKVLSKLVR